MTEAAKIKSLIESVDPNDTAILDEIDARVWCFIKDYQFNYLEHYTYQGKNVRRFRYDDNGTFGVSVSKIKYTRSRDALKAIRPDGWIFDIWHEKHHKEVSCVATRSLSGDFESLLLETEELAELYAIIQAIEFERSQKCL